MTFLFLTRNEEKVTREFSLGAPEFFCSGPVVKKGDLAVISSGLQGPYLEFSHSISHITRLIAAIAAAAAMVTQKTPTQLLSTHAGPAEISSLPFHPHDNVIIFVPISLSRKLRLREIKLLASET